MPAKAKAKILKEQIRALGGTDEDFELVKDADSGNLKNDSQPDAQLSKDVSQFLKSLNRTDIKNTAKSKKKPEMLRPDKSSSKPRPEVSDKSSPKPQPKISDNKPPPKSSQKVSEKPVKSQAKASTKTKYLFQPTPEWHSVLPTLSLIEDLPTPTQLSSLASKAALLHDNDVSTFQSSSSSGPSTSEASFLSKIIQSGTLSDRLSALTLLVQSSPLHNTKALDTLKGMAERGKGKGGREESLKALRCIVDWWVGGGAPSRKLKYFRDQPLLHPDVTDAHLVLWHFEDWLKKFFFSILQILETFSLDPLPYVRTQSLRLIYTLLAEKPEQEQNLLRLLVNKLGDPDKSLGSRASYHLLQLLQTHPSMKAVVVREIISLILKPSNPSSTATSGDVSNRRIKFSDPPPAKSKASTAGSHARYYATITFNQIVLSPTDDDREVAMKLMEVYFEMFRELLGDGQEDDDTAVPPPEAEEEDAEVKKDKAGRIRDKKKGKARDVGEKKDVFTEVEDSKSKLISAILTGVNRALPFAKLGAGDGQLMKHIDTLFFITHNSTFNISLQALVLIQQISASLSSTSKPSATAKSITDRYYRTLYASLQDPRLATSNKQAMYLNLFFKSIKADVGRVNDDGEMNERIMAFVRRFVQLLVSGGNGATEFVAGGLFLLGELFSSIPGLRSMITENSNTKNKTYDPHKRDPQYAHASSSPLWELTPLLSHYHPTISLHARQLLVGQPLTASPNLSLNTLSHFLDRFVYKNPKKIKASEDTHAVSGKAKGPSAMQPAASGVDGTGVKLTKGEVFNVGGVNEGSFLRRKEEDIPVDEVFFHKFFVRKAMKDKGKKKQLDGEVDGEDDGGESQGSVGFGGSDEEDSEEEMDLTGDEAKANVVEEDEDEDEDSDAEEDEIWKAMKATIPREGDDDLSTGEEDSDDIPSGLDAGDSDDDEDGLSLVEASDNEDLVSLDGDIPEGLIEFDGSDDDDADEEEWTGISADADNKKRKRAAGGEEKQGKNKKLRSLPTFASYEEYAKMIEDGPEDLI